MPAQDTNPKLVQFGVFELDLQQGELRKQGVKVKLQEQPLKVLQLLLETLGEIVSRSVSGLRPATDRKNAHEARDAKIMHEI